jgi:hypothetical protein
MTIASRTHKLLWSRAHDMCAMCRRPLTEVEGGSGRVLGEEAHIIAQPENGPRGRAGDRANIDGYDNLILLCADDHKRIDSQPDKYSADWLRAKKAEHEAWARAKVTDEPLRIVVARDEASIQMVPILTGDAVWDLVAGAAMFDFQPPLGDSDPAASDAADEFLTTARDTGGIYEAIQDDGFRAVRDAKRVLQEMILGLWERDLFVYGRRVSRTLKGGVGNPMPFDLATLAVLTAEQLRERGGFVEED